MDLRQRKNTYFLSDFHLGSKWFSDPHEAEKRVVSFLDSIKDDAKAIYLLGDILDYWFEYRYVVPRGFVRFLGKVAELADSGVKITWMIGNHDIWIFDYLPRELGIEVVDGSLIRRIDGKLFFLSHGDGVGEQPLRFRFIRSFFRNRVCQKLFSAIHPRWTVPFAYGWSRKNRGIHPLPDPYRGVDDEPLMIFAKEYLARADVEPVDYFIFGHRHVMAVEELKVASAGETRQSQAVILGEWIDLCSYACFDGETLSINRYSTETS